MALEETNNEKPKRRMPAIFGNLGNFFRKALQSAGMLLASMLGLMMACLILFMAYVMFAPDSWPKPFYLSYQNNPGESASPPPANAETAGQAPASSSVHSSENASEPKVPSVPLEIKAGQGIFFDSGAKIVNLADPSGRRYIKTNIILEYAPNDITYFLEAKEPQASEAKPAEGAKEGAAAELSYADKFRQELEPKRPLIDDTIITVLSSKTFEDVYSAAGKDQLRKEIIGLLNSRMPEYRVIFVYFTEFTVQ